VTPLDDDDTATADGGSEKLGRIQFTLGYDFEQSTLTLKIIRAVDLAAKDITGRSDPYVKVMLLPDKKHKLLTNIKRRNLNPRWNELFAFEGQHSSMLLASGVGVTKPPGQNPLDLNPLLCSRKSVRVRTRPRGSAMVRSTG